MQTPGARARRLIAFPVVLVLFASLLALGAPGIARASHDVSDPEPSAPNCEWYGSVEYRLEVHSVDPVFDNTHDLVEHGVGWSGPSDDSTCRGFVHWTFSQYDTSPGGLWWRRTADGTVPATYDTGWGFADSFFATFSGDEMVTMTLTDFGGGTQMLETPVGAQAGCAVPGVDTDAERGSIQAVVVTCSQIQEGTGDPSETWTGTIRMRRTDCDATVDTDGGGVVDCTEFAVGTDPADSADDRADSSCDDEATLVAELTAEVQTLTGHVLVWRSALKDRDLPRAAKQELRNVLQTERARLRSAESSLRTAERALESCQAE